MAKWKADSVLTGGNTNSVRDPSQGRQMICVSTE